MKSKIIAFSLSTTLIPLATFGGEYDGLLAESDLALEKGGGLVSRPAPAGRMRAGIGFAPLLGVEADFTGLGASRNPLLPQPLGGGQNYNYDDGFVRLDSTGNAGGNTWNWGRDNAAQFDAAGGGSIAMSISNGQANGSASGEDDLAAGFEGFVYLEFGEVPGLDLGGGPARWGLKANLHYASISIDSSGTVAAGVSRITDTFQLGGVVPPQAPFAGSFNGPGPVISDSPTRASSIIPGGATVTGSREVDVDLFGMTVGPYLEVPVGSRVLVSLESGFSLAVADGYYKFNSATTIPGAGTQTNAGSDSETTLLPGVSAGLSVFFQATDAWSVYGGARYQYYYPFEIDAGTSQAELDFGAAFVLSAGAAFNF